MRQTTERNIAVADGPQQVSVPSAVADGSGLWITTRWNDTDIALAHLITFRCHGTWLHGDERGSGLSFQRCCVALYQEKIKRGLRLKLEVLY